MAWLVPLKPAASTKPNAEGKVEVVWERVQISLSLAPALNMIFVAILQ